VELKNLQNLLDEGAAARALGVSPNTLRKWRCIGKGPRYVKVGRLIRYRPSALEAFSDANDVEPSDHTTNPERSEAAKERMRHRVLARATIALPAEVRVLQ
jgi:hypothetical protein